MTNLFLLKSRVFFLHIGGEAKLAISEYFFVLHVL